MLKVFPLSSQDFVECMAYAREEPYGSARDDLRHGLMLSMFHMANKPKGADVLHWYDFLPNGAMPDEAWEKLQDRIKQAAEERRRKEEEDERRSQEAQCENAIALFKAFNQRWEKKPDGKRTG